MNIYQRVILVLGAIILVIAIWTTPRLYVIGGESYRTNAPYLKDRQLPIAKMMDVGEASMRAVTVLGVTALLCAALKDVKKRTV